MIKLQNLSGGYKGRQRLFDISLSVPPRSITSVVGPNGCGKTTLLRTVCGLQRAFGGEIQIGGKALSSFGTRELAKTVSFLPQGRDIPNIRVENLILHGRFPYMGYPRRYREEDREKVQAAMEWAGILPLYGRSVAELSGGERQKVYIAMLLAQETPVVLLDEPTSYLDISHKFDVMQLVKRMRDEGKTVVMVLHDLDMTLSYSDQILLMDEGRVRAFGTPEEVLGSGSLEEVFRVRIHGTGPGHAVKYFAEPL